MSPQAEQRRQERDAGLALRRRVAGWVGVGSVALTGILLLTAENSAPGSSDAQPPTPDQQQSTSPDQQAGQDPSSQQLPGNNFGAPVPPRYAPVAPHAVSGGS